MSKADIAIFGVVATLAQVGVTTNGVVDIFVIVFADVVDGAEGGGEVGVDFVAAFFEGLGDFARAKTDPKAVLYPMRVVTFLAGFVEQGARFFAG